MFESMDGRGKVEFFSCNVEETDALGKKIGKLLKKNDILAFFGDLGSGKTTLIRSIVSSFSECLKQDVVSPTFTYLNIYSASCPIYHFDLYRVKNSQVFLEKGFDEYFFAEGICLIEWSERIVDILPKNAWEIHLEHKNPEERNIVIVGGIVEKSFI